MVIEAVEALHITGIVLGVLRVEQGLFRFCIEQDHISDVRKFVTGVTMRRLPLPSDLVSEITRVKDRVEQYFQIMTRCRIAVQVKRTGRFEHAVQLNQPNSHHGEVRHHVILAERRAHSLEHDRGIGVRPGYYLIKGTLGGLIPVPRVLERLDLGLRLLAGRRLEQDVIGGIGVERRIEVDHVHRIVRDALPEHGEVVAVVEGVFHAA